MKTGVFTVSMPEYTPEEAVVILKELGYDGVEWRVAPIEKAKENVPFGERYWNGNKCTLDIETIEQQADYVKTLCSDYDLSILSLTTYLKPFEYDRIEHVLKAASVMNCPQIRVFTPDYKEAEDHEALFSQTIKDIRYLETLAKKYQVKIVFEIHMDNIAASASAARRLLDGIDPACIGVIFDPGNMVFEGFENYKKSFEMLGKYIAHVHIKNGKMEECGMDEDGTVQWKRSWTPLQKGTADLKKLFSVMREMNYRGNISIEDFSNEESTYDKLKHNIEYLKKLTV